MGFKKGIATILVANILNLLFQLLTNFLLPKYLTVQCYAEIKTFQLYVSYVGALHLGYCDGMYIKYGGRTIQGIDNSERRTDAFTLELFQLVVTVLFTIVALCLRSATLLACAIAILPLNMVSYYKLLFQATGEFRDYARISNITTVLTFVANMGLLLLGRFSEFYLYLLSYIAVDFLILWACVLLLKKHSQPRRIKGRFNLKNLLLNIQSGFFLMLGNFSSIILTGMDRWFIKALMDDNAFAMYSFAVSMENMMNVAVTPVSTTLYNYFCVHKDEETLEKIKGKIILFASVIVACAFPAKFVLETFLPKYLDSSGVIFYLFGAQIFYIIVKCFYVNLYKAQKRQRVYFIKLTAVFAVGFLFNAGLYAMMHTKEAFAIGTMLCGIVWYFLSELDFPQFRSGWRENLFLILSAVSYLALGMFVESLVGLVLYVVLLLLLGVVLMRNELFDCFQMAKSIIGRK